MLRRSTLHLLAAAADISLQVTAGGPGSVAQRAQFAFVLQNVRFFDVSPLSSVYFATLCKDSGREGNHCRIHTDDNLARRC